MKSFLLWLTAVLMLTTSAFAQLLHLKDGSFIEGAMQSVEANNISIMTSIRIPACSIGVSANNTHHNLLPRRILSSRLGADYRRASGVGSIQNREALDDAHESKLARSASFYFSTLLFILVYAGFVLGALLCFFGRRLFRQLMAIVGVCLGGTIGWVLTRHVLSLQSFWVSAFAIVLAAALFGLLFAASVYLMIFLNGFSMGAVLGHVIWGITNLIGLDAPTLLALLVFILGLVGGVTALVYREILLAIATAFWGSSLLVYSVFGLIGALVVGQFLAAPGDMMPPVLELMSLGLARLLLPIAIFALTIFGSVYQLKHASRIK